MLAVCSVRRARPWRQAARVCSSTSIPLTEEWPGLPTLRPASKLERPEQQTAEVPNGAVISAEDNSDHMCSLSMLMRSGSAHESPEEYGMTNFLSKLAFQSTKTHTPDSFMREMTEIGATPFIHVARDSLLWQLSALRDQSGKALELLMDTVLHNDPTDQDIQNAVEAVTWESQSLEDAQRVVELLHSAAYGSESPMGHSIYPSPERLADITPGDVKAHVDKNLCGPNMLVAGVGVDPKPFTAACSDLLQGLPAEDRRPGLGAFDSSFVSGEVVQHMEDSDLAHVAVAFPVQGGWRNEEDIFPLCVLQTLLGGGSAFSAGGPGKGMYTRLYREVLGMYGWSESIQATAMLTDSCGFMMIQGSCHPKFVNDMARVCLLHLLQPASVVVKDEEFLRARNMLSSMVLMNLEFRSLHSEDAVRQLAAYGQRFDGQRARERIERVTPEAIQRVARTYTGVRPAFAVTGNATNWSGADKVLQSVMS